MNEPPPYLNKAHAMLEGLYELASKPAESAQKPKLHK